MAKTSITVALMTGSIRKERRSDKPAKSLLKLLKARDIKIIELDLQKLDLPLFDDGLKSSGKTKLLNAYKKMDGLILVSPEYNHSISSATKNAIDFARDHELSDKPAAIVTTSNGPWGGARSLSEVRNVWLGVKAIVVPPFLQVPNLSDFDPSDEDWQRRANDFLDATLHWFRVIKDGQAKNKR